MSDVQQSQVPAERKPSAIEILRNQLDRMSDQFKNALPAHIPVERFGRVVMTAIQNSPDLVAADRPSLFNAAMRAAQDGLLPDGREGAMVIYSTKVKVPKEGGGIEERWIKKVQWMPMIAGIFKKIRNSGEVVSLAARVVYGGDKFRNWIDDTGEHIEYEASETQDRTIVRMVFAMAKTKSGDLYVECMTPEDVEDVRSCSKAKDNGPWVDWWDQMAIKTAFRRLSKRVPMSTDLDDLIRRDDDLYDFDAARKEARARGAQNTIAGRLQALATVPGGEAMDHKPGSSTSGAGASGGSGEGAAASGSGSEGMQDQGSGAAGAGGGQPAKTRQPRKPRGSGGAQADPPGDQPGDPGAGATIDHDPQTGEVIQQQATGQTTTATVSATPEKTVVPVDAANWAEYFAGWKARFAAIASAEEGDAVKATYSSMDEKRKRNALIKTDKDADERDNLLEILGAKLAEFKKA